MLRHSDSKAQVQELQHTALRNGMVKLADTATAKEK
jgi:hypothetical protein